MPGFPASDTRDQAITPLPQAEAELAHLQPKHEPAYAGIVSATVVGLLLSLFCTFAGLDLNRFGLPAAAVLALVFAGPWLYYRSQQKRYYTETARLELALERARDTEASRTVG